MITSRQVRAARALLGWTQEMLADRPWPNPWSPKAGSRCERTRVVRYVAHSRKWESYFWPLNRAKG
jgi:hypothetical protein